MQCLSCKKYVIVLACGIGHRMHNNTPKQFLLLEGKPIVMHTLENIYSFDRQYNIILVINEQYENYWQQLEQRYNFKVPYKRVFGGKERYYSVKNALDTIQDSNALVAIHDGVRPFATKQMFEDSFSLAQDMTNAICAISSTDSVRIKKGQNYCWADRNNVFLVQTPQTFDLKLIKRAYQQPYNESFTDDASVVESFGVKINIVQGDKRNIKITYPFDLLVAHTILTTKE